MPQIPALGTETIYMYYGNTTAPSAGNASAVFDFFDDFMGTELNLGKWTWRTVATSGGIPVQPGIGYVTVANSTVSVVSPNTDGWEQATELTTIFNFTLPVVLEGNLSVPNWGGYGSAGYYRAAWGGLSDSNMSQGSSFMRHGVVFFLASENEYCPYVLDEGVSGHLSNYPDTPIDFHTYRAIWKTNSTEFYRDGIYHEEATTNVPNVSIPIWFLTSQWGGPGWPDSRIEVDWVRVRKYAFSEPTYLIGSEETLTFDLYRGLYQNESGSDGIFDIPYIIDENNRDRYPLKKPYGGPCDIGMTSLTPSKTVVGQGYSLSISAKIVNYGINTETFNITINVNTTILATFKNVSLISRNSTTITFTWNTTGFAKGNYTIWAYAWPVPDETDTADNTFTDGWVIVSMVGDLTGGTANLWDFVPDGKVDGKDLSVVARCFGSWPGAPPPMIWNPNCDINNDEKVDGKDRSIGAKHYGESDP